MKKLAVATALLITLGGCDSASDKASPNSADPKASPSQSTQAEKKSSANPAKIESEKQTPTEAKKNHDPLTTAFKEANHLLFQHRAVAASLYGISEADAGYHYQSNLENYSSTAEHDLRSQMRMLQQRLGKQSWQQANREENRQVVADITDYYAGMDGQENGFIDIWMGHSAFVVNQINGPMIDIPNNMLNSHQIHNLADANDYLSRLKAFKALSQSVIEKMNTDAARNWLPPRVLAKKSLNYLDKFTSVAPEQSPLYQNFKNKLTKLESVDEQKKQKLLAIAKTVIQLSVYQGFEDVAAALQKILPRTRLESGIWAQPGGAEFYQYSIQKLGDTDLSAEQIHQLGLSEVDRINAEMDTILKSQGLTEGTPGERMQSLNSDPRFLYSNDDKGRSQLLADLNGFVADISKAMPAQFATTPKYPVEIKRIPVATEDSSAGGYYTSPSMDGKVAGIYWINLKDTHTNPKFTLKTLTFHEAIPGHHWQIALNLGQTDLPLLRRIAPYNAYVEGWALYSEKVAAEMGMYKDDPFGDLGRLQAELYRAVRLVVDTGMHYKKWSREQAIDYMVKTTGSPESDVVSEIERYMAWPGQALGYKLGMLKILELRAKARQALGENFDIKAFHDVILLGGAVPMKVLEAKVNHWIEQQLAQQSSKLQTTEPKK